MFLGRKKNLFSTKKMFFGKNDFFNQLQSRATVVGQNKRNGGFLNKNVRFLFNEPKLFLWTTNMLKFFSEKFFGHSADAEISAHIWPIFSPEKKTRFSERSQKRLFFFRKNLIFSLFFLLYLNQNFCGRTSEYFLLPKKIWFK